MLISSWNAVFLFLFGEEHFIGSLFKISMELGISTYTFATISKL